VGVVAYFLVEVLMMVEGAVELVRRRRPKPMPGASPCWSPSEPSGDHRRRPRGELDRRPSRRAVQIAILMGRLRPAARYADRRPETREIESVQPRDALKVGLAQALALAPGVSRSGNHDHRGRFLGLSRDAAARFGFFLLVPVTAAR
jgi:hypothetical protein